MPILKHAKTGHVIKVTDGQAKVIQANEDWKKAPAGAVVGPNPDYKPKDGDK